MLLLLRMCCSSVSKSPEPASGLILQPAEITRLPVSHSTRSASLSQRVAPAEVVGVRIPLGELDVVGRVADDELNEASGRRASSSTQSV